MDISKFIKDNKSKYTIFTFEKTDPSWDQLVIDLGNYLSIGDNTTESYLIYGGLTVLTLGSLKLILVPIILNKTITPHIKSLMGAYSKLKEFSNE